MVWDVLARDWAWGNDAVGFRVGTGLLRFRNNNTASGRNRVRVVIECFVVVAGQICVLVRVDRVDDGYVRRRNVVGKRFDDREIRIFAVCVRARLRPP